MRNRDEWWDWSHLVIALAERLIMDAHQYRKAGVTLDSERTAEQMESAAWKLLDIVHRDEAAWPDFDEAHRKKQETLKEALAIIEKHLFDWWD